MGYTKTNWVDGSSPAINAQNLNKMEQGIYNATYGDNTQTYKVADAQNDDEAASWGQVKNYVAENGGGSGGGSASGTSVSGYRVSVKKTKRNAVFVPWYAYPQDDNGNWTDDFLTLLDVTRRYCQYTDIVIAPGFYEEGAQVDETVRYAVKCLKGAGAIILGYIATGYGERDINEIAQSMENYKNNYEYVEGYFFDEHANDWNKYKDYYRQIHQLAMQYDPVLMIGNPGTGQDYQFYQENLCDVYNIHEDQGYPTIEVTYGQLSDGENYGNYDIPFEMKAVLSYGVDPDFDQWDLALENVKFVYFNDYGKDGGDTDATDPTQHLPTYFEKLVEYVSFRGITIFKDQSTGTRYKQYVDNGTLKIEEF